MHNITTKELVMRKETLVMYPNEKNYGLYHLVSFHFKCVASSANLKTFYKLVHFAHIGENWAVKISSGT